MNVKTKLTILLVLIMGSLIAQPENWFNLDPKTDGVPGLGTEKMYQELLKGKTGQTVIVAVLDSGVDAEHEDLKEVMWVNQDEIPNNGIDDDKNGYVDDIHGWNFIGGKDGNVQHDNLEVTRLYRSMLPKFENADVSKLSSAEKKEYQRFKKMEKEINKKQESMGQNAMLYGSILESVKALGAQIGKKEITAADVANFETEDEQLVRAKAVIGNMLAQGESFDSIVSQLEEAYEYFSNQLNYYYNPDFDPRSIVGDNYNNIEERIYGNNDVQGPDADHGTHVAGIVAANRTNDIGIKGVADNVRIMSVRCVPDGDERDKDVANAIRYAVDNGASIINMSFGKGYSWDKDAVDKAVKYAMKKDVLLVHAAGNSNADNDKTDNFPNDVFNKRGFLGLGKKKATNWMEIGALNWEGGANLAASFSNYGKENVDVFAPGVDILSSTPDDGYQSFPGTSMASPMVAGVAAVLRSYFPTLTAEQVKEVIMTSSSKQTQKVVQPGSDDKVPFSSLSVSGGTLNAYNAVKVASTVKGKKKIKAGSNKAGAAGKNKVAVP